MSVPNKSNATPASSGGGYLTLDAIAQRWGGCHVETIKRIAKRNLWPTFRMGGRVVRFKESDVIAYEAACADIAPVGNPNPRARRN